MTLSRKRTASVDALLEPSEIEAGRRREGVLDEAREIDRTEQAGAVGRQRLLAARIGGVDLLAVVQVVTRIDAVDEDDARLGEIVGRLHQRSHSARAWHGAVDLAAEVELPGPVLAHGGEKRVRHQHRQIEVAQALGIGLGVDEGLDVG